MEPTSYTVIQQALPDEYLQLSDAELDERIARARAALGRRLVILGHHYQRDEVIKFADMRGDSLKLSRWAAQQREASYIVFCGVHFMAETADILAAPGQAVVLPDLGAGCSMADMAPAEQVEEAWSAVHRAFGGDVLPVTYINSSAAVKAFVGARGGAVCTSSNAAAVLRWALERARTVFFLPDEHLGRNTGVKLGIPFEAMAVWNREEGRLDPDPHATGAGDADPARVRLVLWNGYCSVHQRFTPQQVERVRQRHPGIRVVVHPECRWEVVRLADACGSTEFIIKTVAESPAGSRWAVGTEINLVNRLATENPDKLVMTLDEIVCPCSTMYRISPQHLCWALENLVAGRVVNRIQVSEDVAEKARIALDRMLTIA